MELNVSVGFHTVTPGTLEWCFMGASELKRFPPNNDNSNCLRTHLLFVSFGFLFSLCVWVWVCTDMSVCVCMHVWRQRLMSCSITLHLIFRDSVSQWTWSSPFQLDWMISEHPWDPPVSLSQCQGYRCTQLLPRCWGSRTQVAQLAR